MFFSKRKLNLEKVKILKDEALATHNLDKLDRFMSAADTLSKTAIAEKNDDLALQLAILITDCFYDFNVDKKDRGKYLSQISTNYLNLARSDFKNKRYPKAKLYYLEAIKLTIEMYEIAANPMLYQLVSTLYMELGDIYIIEEDEDSAIKNYRNAYDFARKSVSYSYIEDGYYAMAKSRYMLAKLGDNSKENISHASEIITKLTNEYPDVKLWAELKDKIYALAETIDKYTNTKTK